MNRWTGIALAVAAGGVLVACNQGPKTPTGQVVATIGKHEITTRDVRSEMGAFQAPNPQAMKAAEKRVIDNIIGRDIIADEARKEGLEKTPDFAIARQRAIDSLLVQALQQKVAAQVPKATTEEAQRFVQANPDMFAERKVFILDQLQMPRPSDPALVKALEPMKTFDQIQALLTQQKIPFKRVQTGLDAVGADPRLIQAILKLPPDELFLLPSGQALTVNQIKETKVIPFTGDKAVAYAQQVVTRQRTQEALQRRIQELLAARRNDVRYSKDFAPPPKPPASSPTPAKPGTAPSPAAAAQSGGG